MKTQLQLFAVLVCMGLFTLSTVTAQSQRQWWQDWTKNITNPVLQSSPTTWFEHALPPNVIYDNGTYKMWFTGWGAIDAIRRVGYATSDNGVVWSIHPTFVLEGDVWDSHIYISTVLKVKDTLKMWYAGATISPFEPAVGYAWSLDGINWNRHETPVMTKGEPGSWDANLVNCPIVIYDGSEYHMYYDNMLGIGYATSPDGINWTKFEGNPVHFIQPNTFYDDALFASGALLYNDTIHMWFTGRNDEISIIDRIGYGYSTDFTTFNWSVDTALHTGPLTWDEASVDNPSIMVDGRNYRMWYTGTSRMPMHFKIGTALGAEAPCVPVYFSGCEDGHGFTDFKLNEIQNMGSGCASMDGTGWSEYFDLGPATVELGTTETVSIKSGHDMQYTSMWVDWNQNMEYEKDEMVVDNFLMETAGTSYNVLLEIPDDIETNEIYYLRAKTNYNDSCNDACCNQYFGETEDYQLYTIMTGIIEPQVIGITVSPNPTKGLVSFQFTNQGTQNNMIKIYDIRGCEVATVLDKKMPAGQHSINFDMGKLPPGIYIYKQSAAGSRQLAVGKLIKL